MRKTIRTWLAETAIVDVHEHHMPEVFLSRDVNLLGLFQQSYAGWTQARPYRLPSEPADTHRSSPPPPVPATSWESLTPFLEQSGTNAFVRNLIHGITALHGNGADSITPKNWEAIDASVRTRHRDPNWCREVLRRARVERVITDPYSNPILDAPSVLGPEYRSVLRINAFAMGWHPRSCDHNGNNGQLLLQALGLEPRSFAEYLEALETLVDTLAVRHQVGLKNALAYDRDLDFADPNRSLARRTWGQAKPTPAERKAFSDFIVDHLCTLAGQRDIPMQMHLGTALIRGAHPLLAARLIERHPGTRFLLMHLAYPWSRDLLGMAFVYRNIWLDLTWSMLLSPSHFKLALHEAIDVLTDESRMMLGGDNWHAEETYGTVSLARRLIGEVLEEKVAAGDVRVSDAHRLATRVLRTNALRFFKLDDDAA